MANESSESSLWDQHLNQKYVSIWCESCSNCDQIGPEPHPAFGIFQLSWLALVDGFLHLRMTGFGIPVVANANQKMNLRYGAKLEGKKQNLHGWNIQKLDANLLDITE